jgi:hypothetical protein
VLGTTDDIQALAGNIIVGTAGKGIWIKEGANATAGLAILVGGTVTVPNTRVSAATRVKASVQSLGTVTRPCAIGKTAQAGGVSFTLMSSDPTDTSTVYWEIIGAP